jgi:hypothetical protein
MRWRDFTGAARPPTRANVRQACPTAGTSTGLTVPLIHQTAALFAALSLGPGPTICEPSPALANHVLFVVALMAPSGVAKSSAERTNWDAGLVTDICWLGDRHMLAWSPRVVSVTNDVHPDGHDRRLDWPGVLSPG